MTLSDTSQDGIHSSYDDGESQEGTSARLILRKLAPPALLGLILAALVCAPFFRGGWLLLLDWVVGPHTPILGPTFYGLNGGINGDLLLWIVTTSLVHLFGSSMTWMPIFVFFPLATVSMATLVKGNMVAKLSAGLFFAMNPFVISRIYVGQIAVIYGYLLLPLLFNSCYHWMTEEQPKSRRVALFLTLMIAVDVHYAWIGGLVIAAGIIVGFTKSREFRFSVLRLPFILVILNIYLIIPVLGHQLSVDPKFNNTLLEAFKTRPDPHLGLLINTLGLYGFWRPMPETSKSLVSGWPLLLLAILIVSGYGLWNLWKSDKKLASFFSVAFALGLVSALGSQGPTGWIFRWAYDTIPSFSMMREPEKFSAIVATVLSVALGYGMGKLWSSQNSKKLSAAVLCTGFVMIIAYDPIAFWGIHDQLATSELPSSWSLAAEATQRASGYTLVLPWDLYLAFPVTDHRVVGNPGPAFLPGNIISGDNIEMDNVYSTSTSQRSSYIQQVLSSLEKTDRLGSLLAPLGIQYIVIFKTYATGNLDWVNKQVDLSVISHTSSEITLQNDAYVGIAQHIARPFSGTFSQILKNPRTWADPGVKVNASQSTNVSQVKEGTTEIHVSTPVLGWLNVAIPYSNGWNSASGPPEEDLFGTLVIHTNQNTLTLQFNRWIWVGFGYAFSALASTLIAITSIRVNNAPRQTST